MKAIKRDNFRVEIYPKTRVFGIKVSEEDETCKQILEQVRRHVDSIGCAGVACDKIGVCEFCGSKWTEDGTIYNGGCCDKDEANNPEQKQV